MNFASLWLTDFEAARTHRDHSGFRLIIGPVDSQLSLVFVDATAAREWLAQALTAVEAAQEER